MHTAIRKYRSSDPAELARRVETGFVPIVKEVPGFVGYYVVDGGDGTVTSVTVCEDEGGVEESTRRAGEWVQDNVPELVEGAPDVTSGEVLVRAER
jgi:hypothetical protein